MLGDLPAELQPYRASIEETCRDVVLMRFSPSGFAHKLWESKFGGLPYLLLSEDFPTDPKGVKLDLLLQINFNDIPKGTTHPSLPSRGILQWFVRKGDKKRFLEGNADFVLKWYPDFQVEGIHTTETFENKFKVIASLGEQRIDFTMQKAYLPIYDKRFPLRFPEIAANEELTRLYVALVPGGSGEGHKLGGYPAFKSPEHDPRDIDLPEVEEVLVQLDAQATCSDGFTLPYEGRGYIFVRARALDVLKRKGGIEEQVKVYWENPGHAVFLAPSQEVATAPQSPQKIDEGTKEKKGVMKVLHGLRAKVKKPA